MSSLCPQMKFENSKPKQKFRQFDSLEAEARVVQDRQGNRREEEGSYYAHVSLYTTTVCHSTYKHTYMAQCQWCVAIFL
jgi:hypothetical protein